MTPAEHEDLDRLLCSFLEEDLGGGDVTTEALVGPERSTRARLIARQSGVVSGLSVAERVFTLCGPTSRFVSLATDGSPVSESDEVATVEGPAMALLAAERTALNLLQRMSGIATTTRRYVEAVAGTRAVILETRKTAPGLRRFDKQAVRDGGGQNHRMGLFDQVLIKENHVAMLGGEAGGPRPIEEAVSRARATAPAGMVIEIEVLNAREARRAAEAGADVVLLDNFSVAEVARTVEKLVDLTAVELEASGGIDLANVRDYARTGVHRISVGALTHSSPALDLSLLFDAP